ncbi:hypothetical protein KUTeg_001124, partial [Tegillarca granosa]
MDENISWLPSSFHVTESTASYISGWVSDEKDLGFVLEAHRRSSLCTFVTWLDFHLFNSSIIVLYEATLLKDRRVATWNDIKKKKKSERRLLWKCDGVSGVNCPFVVDRSVVYCCQYGKPRKQSGTKNTKKVDCVAKLFVRYISRYDDYAVTADASRIMKQNKMDMLHDCIRKGNAKKTKAIHIKMPLQEAHTNHTVSLESGFSRSMHSKLRDLIIQHVQMGVTSVPYLRRLLRSYVQKEINDSNIINPCETDRSYFPTTRDIYNSVHAALVTGRYSQFDQENLLQKIEEWKKQNPENIIKQWNPKWSPKYFMMDYSDQEYQAIHHTFPDTAKYLCYFHVEQSWMRWTRQ